MTAEQRRVVLGVCIVVGLTLLVAAGLTFLVEPMAVDLGLPDIAVEDALVVPAVASLLVVFVAGRAGDRWGARRTITAASMCFTAGSIVPGTTFSIRSPACTTTCGPIGSPIRCTRPAANTSSQTGASTCVNKLVISSRAVTPSSRCGTTTGRRFS